LCSVARLCFVSNGYETVKKERLSSIERRRFLAAKRASLSMQERLSLIADISFVLFNGSLLVI